MKTKIILALLLVALLAFGKTMKYSYENCLEFFFTFQLTANRNQTLDNKSLILVLKKNFSKNS
jgi:hypothetical protein